MSWEELATRLQAEKIALHDEIERLREALSFYAEEGNWTARNPRGSGAPTWNDHGTRARDALNAS
jgi:hypothetical protein